MQIGPSSSKNTTQPFRPLQKVAVRNTTEDGEGGQDAVENFKFRADKDNKLGTTYSNIYSKLYK